MREIIPVQVECHAGYKADERPLRFRLGDCWHEVAEVLEQWYGPDDLNFRVRAGDGNIYHLRRGHPEGRAWELIAVK